LLPFSLNIKHKNKWRQKAMSPLAEQLASEIQERAEEDPQKTRLQRERRVDGKLNKWAGEMAEEEDFLVKNKLEDGETPAPTTNISKLKALDGFEGVDIIERAIVEDAFEAAVGSSEVVEAVEELLRSQEEHITQEHDLPRHSPRVLAANAVVEASKIIAGAPDPIRDELAVAGEEECKEVIETITEEKLEDKIREIELHEQKQREKRRLGKPAVRHISSPVTA
jgi:hypothetical protein